MRKIDYHLDQIVKKEEWKLNWIILLYPNLNAPQITNLEKEIANHEKAIEDLKKEISELQDDLGEIYDWYKKMLEWAQEKYEKAVDALEQLTRDCLANERNDD